MDYFRRLQELLRIEKDEDKKAYLQLIEGTSVNARRESGITWYPIAIRDTELGRGDYLTVEAERTTHTDLPHLFRFGASAALFSNHHPQDDRLEGTISFISGSRMKIALRTDELPDWIKRGKLGIDLLFDENSYAEMADALSQAEKRLAKGEDDRLIRILTARDVPGFKENVSVPELPALNASQRQAVQMMISAHDLAIVHGPPGTGKTTTLVNTIRYMIHDRPQQILVTAPSNTAVDMLAGKLSEAGLSVLRIGNPARVSDHLMSLTLDARIAAHNHMREIKKMKKRAREFLDMAHKYKRNFGKAERAQRKALFDEAHRILKDADRMEDEVAAEVIGQSQVIAATLVGANHHTIRNLSYETAVIDEAGQAIEPGCWIPALKAKKLILAGDPFQLPPTIASEEAGKKGLSITLLEKCITLHPEAVVLLREQYRMNNRIMRYSSQIFYGDKLVANPAVADHTVFDGDEPFLFIDTAGCAFYEETDGIAIGNPDEAAFLFRHLNMYVQEIATNCTAVEFPTIGIISPYRRQVELLKEQMMHTSGLQPLSDKVTINTIDSFQGQERDVIYISLTRSNPESKIGFLADIRRMNVAMTRARKKLVIIGDGATLSALTFYQGLIVHAEKNDAWKSAWEFAF